MPRRRPFWTGPRRITRRKTRRIRIPQPPERPLQLNRRDLVRPGSLRSKPWQLVIHRRGPRRQRVGENPLETRAVPKSQVRGTLPERIIYKWLRDVAREQFDFQTSLLGGRQELGGIVADFILPFRRIVINPTGPTHDEFLQKRKDQEQAQTLAELGFPSVYFIPEKDVYNEYKFEEIMRGILGLNPSWGSSAFSPHDVDDEYSLARVLRMLQETYIRLVVLFP